ncbi:MAG TPA: amidinotransferase, partial [Pilimelia sp.]|nr:amidinotransferase [Pilimelia sp.]
MIVRPVERMPRKRTYLMCPPEHYTVEYAINPWMDVSAPVDRELAVKQWEWLRETLIGLGHTVHVLPPEPGLPDMVFAANGAFVVNGTAYGARFLFSQRTGEALVHRSFYEANGWRFVAPTQTNEGEGDFAYLPGVHGGIILAGYGYRTESTA